MNHNQATRLDLAEDRSAAGLIGLIPRLTFQPIEALCASSLREKQTKQLLLRVQIWCVILSWMLGYVGSILRLEH